MAGPVAAAAAVPLAQQSNAAPVVGGGVGPHAGNLAASMAAFARSGVVRQLFDECLECLGRWGVARDKAVQAVGVLYQLSDQQLVGVYHEGLVYAKLSADSGARTPRAAAQWLLDSLEKAAAGAGG